MMTSANTSCPAQGRIELKSHEVRAYVNFREKKWGRLGFACEGGKRKSIEYADIRDMEFVPETGILIETDRWQIRIEGRNLVHLIDALESKEVGMIIENHANEWEMEPDDTHINRIVWDRVGPAFYGMA